MIGNLFTATIFGLFFTFMLDCLLYLGIYTNYLGHYNIKEYFNIFFIDNQNPIYFFSVSLFFMITFLFSGVISKIFHYIYLILLITVLAFSLYKPYAMKLGEYIFTKKDKILTIKDKKIYGNVVYENRKEIFFQKSEDGILINLEKDRYKIE